MKTEKPFRDDAIVYDRWAIMYTSLLHSCTGLLSALAPTRALQELEFEWRYRRYIAQYGEADSDIYISTYSKSGTTWTQLILYQLTTMGEMNFDHLFDVSPWLWYAAQRCIAPANPPAPRLLKSHDDYRRFHNRRRGKYIFVIRDGRDVCLSLYHHRLNFKRYQGSFEEHFENFLHGHEYNWFEHVKLWLLNEKQLDMHIVKYEDLKTDFDNTVQTLAKFCGIDVNQEVLQRTREQCSFASMKQHESQLGPRNAHFQGVANAPYEVKKSGQFIRRGEVGEGKAILTQAQLTAYQERFDRSLAGIAAVADYR